MDILERSYGQGLDGLQCDCLEHQCHELNNNNTKLNIQFYPIFG